MRIFFRDALLVAMALLFVTPVYAQPTSKALPLFHAHVPGFDEAAQSIYQFSLFSLKPLPGSQFEDPNYNDFILKNSTPYFTDLDGYEERRNSPLLGDTAAESPLELIEFLTNLLSQIPGMQQDPQDHVLTLNRYFQELIHQVKRDPQKYFGEDYDPAQIRQNMDITNIPYEIVVDYVNRKNAIRAGYWSAPLATFLHAALASVVQESRAFGLFNLVAYVELVLTSAFVNANMKQMYVLHRYYSYLIGQKKYAFSQEKTFDIETATADFFNDACRGVCRGKRTYRTSSEIWRLRNSNSGL